MSKQEPPRPFLVGDEVTWQPRSNGYSRATYYGVVTKVSDKGTVTVCDAQDRSTAIRPTKYGGHGSWLRHVTDHEKARRAWLARRPRSPLVRVQTGWTGERPAAVIVELRNDEFTVANVRAAAVALTEFAAWLAEDPDAIKNGEGT